MQQALSIEAFAPHHQRLFVPSDHHSVADGGGGPAVERQPVRHDQADEDRRPEEHNCMHGGEGTTTLLHPSSNEDKTHPVIEHDSGLRIQGMALWLDATRSRDRCFVSHAHSDHAIRHRRIIASPPTARLYEHRLGRTLAETHAFHAPFEVDGASCRLLPAGHILGSSQILIARIYEEYSVRFGRYELLDPTLGAEGVHGQVVILPPHLRRSQILEDIGPCRTAMLTGWAMDRNCRFRYRVDEAIPLSDHADFQELLALVRQATPKRVYTVHGFPEFAKHLRFLGYDADHLG